MLSSGWPVRSGALGLRNWTLGHINRGRGAADGALPTDLDDVIPRAALLAELERPTAEYMTNLSRALISQNFEQDLRIFFSD